MQAVMRAGVLVVAIGVGALRPGNPALAQDDVLSQAEWARMLVDALGWDTALAVNTEAVAVESLLTHRQRVVLDKRHRLAGDDRATTWAFPVETRPAAWLAQVRFSKGPVFIGVDEQPSRVVSGGNGRAWRDAGVFALSAGAHNIHVTVPEGQDPPDVVLRAGCLATAPPGGWQGQRAVTFADAATTLVRLLRLQERLPAAGSYEIPGEGRRRAFKTSQEGEFTVEARGAASSAMLRLDRCQAHALRRGMNWEPVTSLTLSPGRHIVELQAPQARLSTIQVRLVARRSSGYVDVVEDLGVRLGPAGAPMSRSAARRALEHPTIRVLLRGLPLAHPVAPPPPARAQLPTDEIPPPWAEPVSPVRVGDRTRRRTEDER